MTARFRPLFTPKDVDDALETSRDRTVVVYKHSPICEISADALEEMNRFLADAPAGLDVRIVDVLAARPAAQHLEARTGIRHESPQVLVMSGGDVAWNASHRRITAAAVSKAFAAL